jgi:hypothetical protein
LLVAVPVLGLVMMITAGTASAAHTPANHRAALRAELQHLLSGLHPARHVIGTAGRNPIVNGDPIVNGVWSGYGDDHSAGDKYSAVTAKWTEPKITGCSKSGPLSGVAFWVGIDGLTTPSVEQAGTAAICGQGMSLTYYTWWEMYPSNNEQVVGMTVKPGDQIAASVVRSGTTYTLNVTDSTTAGNSFSVATTCAASCKNQSAEWVAEAPCCTASGGSFPLPQFTPWTVTDATATSGATSGTIKTFPDHALILEGPSGNVLAQPGPLNLAGDSFEDVWHAST